MNKSKRKKQKILLKIQAHLTFKEIVGRDVNFGSDNTDFPRYKGKRQLPELFDDLLVS
jgi:hypothetical protein